MALSAAHDSPASTSRSKSSFVVRLGLTLMALSFLVYPSYALLPFLALEPSSIAGVAVGASLASWGVFSLGAALAGRDATAHLQRAILQLRKRLRSGTPP